MLFDLRGRGRRRAVQGIYLGLAVLMGGGLILFGVGGATSGGLLDAFKSDSGTQSVSDTFKKRVDSAEKGVRIAPTDPKSWAALTKVRYEQAVSSDGFDSNTSTFTDKGKQDLQAASSAWDKYNDLTTKPDPNVARYMVQAYGQAGLNLPDKAVTAMETVIDSEPEPTDAEYVQLAALAYQAGQTRKAELSSKKALSLAPKGDREQIKAELDSARQAASATVSSATPASTAAPSD
jgi:hypothetical protein